MYLSHCPYIAEHLFSCPIDELISYLLSVHQLTSRYRSCFFFYLLRSLQLTSLSPDFFRKITIFFDSSSNLLLATIAMASDLDVCLRAWVVAVLGGRLIS